MSIRQDLDHLQEIKTLIDKLHGTIERLRAAAGLHGARLDGMPHGSGPYDQIGEVIPKIVDAEAELAELRKEYERARWTALDGINQIDDLKISLILSYRYLDGFSWNRIAAELSSAEGIPITEDMARKCMNRWLREHG